MAISREKKAPAKVLADEAAATSYRIAAGRRC
ncbi:hypothetical protein X735_22365 [Mesorhizobium sp. L2C085B000]|nr:hypothetical protein X735_22365 [Mesorhizobium sp. L2C085B000]